MAQRAWDKYKDKYKMRAHEFLTEGEGKLPKHHENNCWAAFGLSKDTQMVCLII